jgi:uncharacterized protein YfaS (alpha-2-macroglobulin family)
MTGKQPSNGRFSWVLVGLAAGIGALVVTLMLIQPGARVAAADVTPQTPAGFQTTEKLILTVNLPAAKTSKSGTLTVELRNDKGELIEDKQQTVDVGAEATSHRFEFKPLKVPADQVTLHCQFEKEKMDVPLAKVLLVKAHETALSSGQEFFAGSKASLRCEVHGVKSMAETVPLPGATVAIRLKDKDGKVTPVYEGKSGDKGIADVQFKVPALPPGAYKMEVATKSNLGEEKLERDVKIKTAPKVLLVTDKPLYQPGQLMHIRALALQAMDLTPVAEVPIVFEVEDAKGNKVFKQEQKTSPHGIAFVDFQLASEVNQGDYHIRAILNDAQSDKTVGVRPYVLPKFKADVTADKKFYLPKETLHLDLQSDYFFGKPVADAKVKITASTFDVAFKDFQNVDTSTDAHGHAKTEIKLPDYFVGLPLAKGNAIVKLEVKITDKADHTETITKTYPVSEQAVQISLIPEAGRLIPGLENRVFAAAIYPDGSPAECEINVWQGQKKPNDKPFATVTTNAAGLAEFKLTPKPEQYRAAEWEQRQVEMLGQQGPQTIAAWAQKNVFDLTAEAKDKKGNQAHTTVALTSEPLGENLLLRLDKAIYKGGDSLNLDIRTSAGQPTVYFDVVRGGQTLLTKWLDVKDGQAKYKLDLPPTVFGTLELHAYQMLAGGEIIRDSRIIYVNAATDLKIDVKADQDVYAPGGKGAITFRVTDKDGNPASAALGILIVDEAVYALQGMQPGLEKVYFTLQEELLKPQAQMLYKPAQGIDTLVREPVLADAQQQVAEVLLTAARPKAPARWSVDPVLERRQKMETQIAQIGYALSARATQNQPFMTFDKTAKTCTFNANLIDECVKAGWLNKDQLTDPMGTKITLESLAKQDKLFTAERLAQYQTKYRMEQFGYTLAAYSNQHQAQFLKDGKWSFPDTIIADAAKNTGYDNGEWLKDAWGNPYKLVRREKKVENRSGMSQFDYYEFVSAGPDGKFDTADDETFTPWPNYAYSSHAWWTPDDSRHLPNATMHTRWGGKGGGAGDARVWRNMAMDGAPGPVNLGVAQGAGGARLGDPKDLPRAEPLAPRGPERADADNKAKSAPATEGAAPPMRLREYFPETLLWQPALITDDKGVAQLHFNFADSITTWRLTASASSKSGSLGGVSAPLRVFQDFFVDIDLPVALTQNDEVAFPVAVYNYLKTPQTVKLQLEANPTFELTDGAGLTRSLDLKPNEVTSVKFRIRAKKVGSLPLVVTATGSKASDKIQRVIDVVPNGRKIEQVVSDRLAGRVSQTIVIPNNAIEDSSQLYVKVYPGVFSQVLEGVDGILRMPGGCFEQTSSSAYPNVLVVDYIKKNKLASPALLLKSEQYLNVGYQRLLTFERPGGGFDWWGSGEPLIWLSAYGLQEFNDMAKVYPIDRGVIERTQAWLLKQREADGTWSKIGATHSVSIERMGDPKLLLTSYVTWSLLDSGVKPAELQKAIEYIRANAPKEENAYVLALAANALAACDAKDDSTHQVLVKVLKKIDEQKQERPDWKAGYIPAKGQSLSYARDDSLIVETTAMAVLAMLKNGQFTNSSNQCLLYLIKSKDPHGTWGSTQATILALKALVAASGGVEQKGEATFTVLVNGKEVESKFINEKNADVMQLIDCNKLLKPGANDVTIDVKGESNLMYQIVGRHFEPWKGEEAAKPTLEVQVEYDRTKLSTADLLRAKATLKNNGKEYASMVMVDLGIPPGFTVDAGDFAEMVAAKKVNKFSVTSRQVTLYLSDVKPGDSQSFEYTLKPKYPIKAQTPATVVYEYYTPQNRGTAKPVEITVEEKK